MLTALEKEELIAGIVITVLCLVLFIGCYVMTGPRRTPRN